MRNPQMRIKTDSVLKGKRVCIILSGTIGSVRGFDLCRALVKLGASVFFVLSKASKELVSKTALEWASGNPVLDCIDSKVSYLEIGQSCHCFLAFASADYISKLAVGIGDDIALLTASVALSSKKPVLVLPLMHEQLLTVPVSSRLKELEHAGASLLAPVREGGKLKVPEISELVFQLEKSVSSQSMAGRKVVVSVGRTSESIDSVRLITNKASGLFGTEIAKECLRRGAEVVVLASECNPDLPSGIKLVKTEGFDSLSSAVAEHTGGTDAYVSTVAVSDFAISGISCAGKPMAKPKKLSSMKEHTLLLQPRQKIISMSRSKRTVAFSYAEKPKSIDAELTVFVPIASNSPGSLDAEILFLKGLKIIGSAKGKKSALAKIIANQIEKLF